MPNTVITRLYYSVLALPFCNAFLVADLNNTIVYLSLGQDVKKLNAIARESFATLSSRSKGEKSYSINDIQLCPDKEFVGRRAKLDTDVKDLIQNPKSDKWNIVHNFKKETASDIRTVSFSAKGHDDIKVQYIFGTKLQRQVWHQLLTIPAGRTMSYGEIATGMGNPKMSRFIGTACGANKVAILVPCHRVKPKAGGFGGYRWGVDIKKHILAL